MIFHRYHGTTTMKIALLFNIFTSEQAINMKLAPNRQQKNQMLIGNVSKLYDFN